MILETKLNNTFAIDQFALEGCSLRPATLSKRDLTWRRLRFYNFEDFFERIICRSLQNFFKNTFTKTSMGI